MSLPDKKRHFVLKKENSRIFFSFLQDCDNLAKVFCVLRKSGGALRLCEKGNYKQEASEKLPNNVPNRCDAYILIFAHYILQAGEEEKLPDLALIWILQLTAWLLWWPVCDIGLRAERKHFMPKKNLHITSLNISSNSCCKLVYEIFFWGGGSINFPSISQCKMILQATWQEPSSL